VKETTVHLFSRPLRRHAAAAGAATPVSEPRPSAASIPQNPSLFRALARPSLCIALAIMPSACLVTSVPQFDEPAQTPPFLVAAKADPDLREFVFVLDDDQRIDFRAAVLSEDRDVPVQIALYIDYGQENAAGNPFKRSIAEFPEILPGTLSQGPRPVQAEWFLDSDDVDYGCHTVTMMVTHAFDFRNCPERLSDSSHLVWNILRCKSQELCVIDPAKQCPNSAGPDLIACPSETPGPDSGSGSGGGQ
jgi:hypothetical protein